MHVGAGLCLVQSPSGRVDAGVPPVRMTIAARTHMAADAATLATFRVLRKPPSDAAWPQMLDDARLAQTTSARGWLDDPGSYHVDPPPSLTSSFVARGRTACRSSASPFRVVGRRHRVFPGASAGSRTRANRTADATVLRHPAGPRPWIVCLHGTAMGRDIDLQSFHVRHLFADLGCNVVLPILPLHGPRREPRVPRHISFDRSARQHPRSRAGARRRPPDHRLDPHAVPGRHRPAGCFARRLRRRARGRSRTATRLRRRDYSRDRLPDALPQPNATRDARPAHSDARTRDRAAYRRFATAPHPPHASTRRFIAAGLVDRLVDPDEQVTPLWHHWQQPNIHWYPGGHIGYAIRRDVRWFVDAAFIRSGVVHLGTVRVGK